MSSGTLIKPGSSSFCATSSTESKAPRVDDTCVDLAFIPPIIVRMPVSVAPGILGIENYCARLGPCTRPPCGASCDSTSSSCTKTARARSVPCSFVLFVVSSCRRATERRSATRLSPRRWPQLSARRRSTERQSRCQCCRQ